MAVRQFPGVEFNNTCVVCHALGGAPDHPTRSTAGAGASTAPPGDFEREPPPAPGSSKGEMSLLAKGNCYRLGSELYLVLPVLCSDGHDGEVLAKAPANTGEHLTDEQVDEICRPLFSPAVRDRLDRAELRLNNMWDLPHDEVVCTARRGTSGPLVGHLP